MQKQEKIYIIFKLPVEKTEATRSRRKKLDDFIYRISEDRVRTHWKNEAELKYELRKAMNNCLKA